MRFDEDDPLLAIPVGPQDEVGVEAASLEEADARAGEVPAQKNASPVVAWLVQIPVKVRPGRLLGLLLLEFGVGGR